MNESVDCTWRDPRLGQDRLHALGRISSTRCLCDDQLAAFGVKEREIRECPTDVDPYPVAHRVAVLAEAARHDPLSESPKSCSYSVWQISEQSTTRSPASPVASIRSARRWIMRPHLWQRGNFCSIWMGTCVMSAVRVGTYVAYLDRSGHPIIVCLEGEGRILASERNKNDVSCRQDRLSAHHPHKFSTR